MNSELDIDQKSPIRDINRWTDREKPISVKRVLYRNLINECKRYGYPFQKGKTVIADMELYLHQTIGTREPIEPKKKNRKCSMEYYHYIRELCISRGYTDWMKVGRTSLADMYDFLIQEGIDYHKDEKIVINQKRRSLSECKTEYLKLLFLSKSYGYNQRKLGRPSKETLIQYLKSQKVDVDQFRREFGGD